MNNRGPGGRPQNAWTPSRKRRLVRLYSLTTLKPNEIAKVLREDGFGPSTRDVQSKLKSLFSADFTKDYRKFRPSSPSNMRTRLERIRNRKRLQHSRTFNSSSKQHNLQGPTMVDSQELGTRLTLVTGTSSSSLAVNAFRNYLPSRTQNGVLPLQRLLPISAESEPTSSANVMLDGSTIPISNTTINISARNEEQFASMVKESEILISRDAAQVASEMMMSSSLYIGRSVASLGRILANQCSSSYLDHIQSVLRSSMSSSWSSGLLSLGSVRRSTHKPVVVNGKIMWNNSQVTQPSSTEVKDTVLRQRSRLTTAAQEIWNDLVCNTEVDLVPKFFSLGYSKMSPGNPFQHSVPLTFEEACDVCGFTRAHWEASRICSEKCDYRNIPTAYINVRDFAGNTPLHCLMANDSMKLEHRFKSIQTRISLGADSQAANKFGQTFLFLLNPKRTMTATETMQFFEMMRFLLDKGYPFDLRDRYGRTFLHSLLRSGSMAFQSVADLAKLARFTTDTYDIFGQRAYDIVVKILSDTISQNTNLDSTESQLAENLLEEFRKLRKTFKLKHLLLDAISDSFPWITLFVDYLKSKHLLTGVNRKGDPCLQELINYWPKGRSDVELGCLISEIIAAGGDIHIRDRKGNTCLAVAAILGHRPVVKVLLNAGANVHCRNFDCKGILEQCASARSKAVSTQDGILYAKIYSCSTLLVDAGAIQFPTETDEWISPSTKKNYANGSYACIKYTDDSIW